MKGPLLWPYFKEDVMETLRKSLGLSFDLPDYKQLFCQLDAERATLWCYLNASPRPCFNRTILAEIRDLQRRLNEHLTTPDNTDQIRYIVYASSKPDIFNLGGDVELFARLIDEGDRDALYAYGRTCVDAVYAASVSCNIPTLTTIALVQGSALGGGLETALACNAFIAEESAQMGFPEILFNLFPGMGAMSLLSRRIGAVPAERLIQSGKMYSGRDLYEKGVIDKLAPDGEGMHATNEYIRQHSRFSNSRLAIRQVRDRVAPVSYEELLDIVEIWVDTALSLTPRDLRTMRRIVSAQSRLGHAETDEDPIQESGKVRMLIAN
jgi:DSF synthase